MVEVSLLNIIIQAIAFTCLLTSFITVSNAQRYLLKTVEEEDPNFNGNGYTSLGIIFAVFALANFVTPFIRMAIGSRRTMFLGSCLQLVYQIQFLYPVTWLLYLSSVLCGFGGDLLWTGHWSYLVKNSTKENLKRNCGIFWTIMQSGRLFGNIFVYAEGFAIVPLTKYYRNKLYGMMVGINILASLIFLVLRGAENRSDSKTDVSDTIRATFKLLYKKVILLLIISFIYCGLQMAFHIGVYSNAIGFTGAFHCGQIRLIALSGFLVGAGIIVAGLVFGIFGHKAVRWGRYPILILGFLIQSLAYIIIRTNLPNSSSNGCTTEKSLIRSNLTLALCCSFLLGFGDICYVTQIYGILSQFFNENISQTYIIFRFVQGAAASAAFFYSSYLGLHTILYILICFGILGTVNFCIVELRCSKDVDSQPEQEEIFETAIGSSFFKLFQVDERTK